MVARIKTFAFAGITVVPIDVEVKLSPGTNAFNIVGLPDKAVAESRERVRASLNSLGIEFPNKRVIVNLAPADILKEGSHYDLPIALGLLEEMGVVTAEMLDPYYVMGELSLDGKINAVNGVLPAAIEANTAGAGIICPQASAKEAAWAGDTLDILAPDHLLKLLNHFKGHQTLSRPEIGVDIAETMGTRTIGDMAEVEGQTGAKRALEIAAAGGHNVMMIGSPGSGKSMLAARFPGILPRPTAAEVLEINMIASLAGLIRDGQLSGQRPFRDPHHSCSMVAMVGGGSRAKPGEVSLAHRGVLFLDELAEFPRAVLEALRQPLETGNISISRANSHVNFPANFQLVAAMNPCRCGYAFDASRHCSRKPKCMQEYQSRISGPLLDRIDLFVKVTGNNVLRTDGGAGATAETSAQILARVEKARQIQYDRYATMELMDPVNNTNATVDLAALKRCTVLDEVCQNTVRLAVDKFGISMRGYNRLLRVARTLADLEGAENISSLHLSEALHYHRSYVMDVAN